MLPPRPTRLLAACVVAALAATPSIGRTQTPPPQIVIGATVAQRLAEL